MSLHSDTPQSYRMEIPQAMSFDDIDPSLALGFLCSSQAEFDDFCLNAVAVPPSFLFPARFCEAADSCLRLSNTTTNHNSWAERTHAFFR